MIVEPTTQMPAAAAKPGTTPVIGPTAPALGKDAFLSLLVTQLQNQDPTAPQDDSAFVAQLAQFSSLEKLTTIDTSLGSILQLLQATTPPPAATDTTTSSSTGTDSGGATSATPKSKTA